MEPLAFAFTAFALLVLPGPTNTVLALSSDELGAARVLQRVAIVVFGYVVIAAPIALLAAPILQDHPIIEKAVKLVSAGWVVYLGYRLWIHQQTPTTWIVGPRRLLVTTLLNPKSLVMGLTMIPAANGGRFPLTLALLVIVVSGTSTIWLALGRLIIGTGARRAEIARRLGSSVLWAFSAVLATSVLT